MTRDLYSNLTATQVLAPAVYDADQNAAAVDRKGFGACLLVVCVGAAGVTFSETVKIELEVEETDDKDHGTWTDVADDDDAVYVTQYRGHKRYCRVMVNLSGAHATGTPLGVIALRGHAQVAPVNA